MFLRELHFIEICGTTALYRNCLDNYSIALLFSIAIPYLPSYILWKKFYSSNDCKIIANNGIGLMNMEIWLGMGFLYGIWTGLRNAEPRLLTADMLYIYHGN